MSLHQFNRLAVAGWLFNKVTGSAGLRTWQMRLFGLLLLSARLVEKIGFLPGLSLVASLASDEGRPVAGGIVGWLSPRLMSPRHERSWLESMRCLPWVAEAGAAA